MKTKFIAIISFEFLGQAEAKPVILCLNTDPKTYYVKKTCRNFPICFGRHVVKWYFFHSFSVLEV